MLPKIDTPTQRQNRCTCSVDKARSFHFVANDHYDVAHAQTSDAVSTLSPLCRNASKHIENISEERHNKLSQDEKSSDGNVKDESNTNTIEGKPVTDRFPADNEKIAKDVGDKKVLTSLLCENDPELETRLSSTNKH